MGPEVTVGKKNDARARSQELCRVKRPMYTSRKSHSCWKVKKLSPRGAQPMERAPPVKKPVYLNASSTATW